MLSSRCFSAKSKALFKAMHSAVKIEAFWTIALLD